jgi:hypothetical protein
LWSDAGRRPPPHQGGRRYADGGAQTTAPGGAGDDRKIGAETIEVRDDGKPRVVLHDLAGWFGTQLKDSFGQIYENVSVAKSEKDLPRERHLEIHILVKRFTLAHLLGGWGNIICSQAKLTWSIGLRMSGDSEYAFSSSSTDFSANHVNGRLGERIEAGEKMEAPKDAVGTAL